MRATAIAVLSATLALGAMSADALAAPKVIKITTIQAAGGPWNMGMLRFKELVEKNTNGSLDVKVYTDGQLGDATQMMTGMQLGAVEMVVQGATSGSFVKGGEPLQVMFVPYLFKSGDMAEKVLNSPELEKIYDQTAKATGMRLIGVWGQRSPRALQTTKGPIKEPANLKGMRVRIPPIPLLEDTFRTLGAQLTSTGMLEIYNSFARGSIDAQDNGYDLSFPLKFHEVAKYWSATDHVREILGWYVAEEFWQTLTPDQQKVIREAAKEGGAVATKLQREADEKSKAAIIAAGTIYTEPDQAAFANAVKDLYKKYEGKVWPDGLVERIRAMQQ
jgi:TRAP-type transport system periplasmic protein